jgi:phage FluMu protein Com
MNLRCAFCQTPYAIGRAETMSALQMMGAEKLAHYDAHCPRCRRVTQIPRQKLEMTMPHWKEALTEAPAPQSAPEVAPVKKVASKPKAESAKKPAAKKPAAVAKKTPAKKSAAK